MMRTHTTRHSSTPTRGIALVEMALVLPLFLLVLLGMIEYSWMFWKNQQINNAAREGARIAIFETSLNADVTAAVDQVMNDAGFPAGVWTTTITPADVLTVAPGDPIEVNVSVDYSDIDVLGTSLLPLPATIGGSTTMAKEGPQ
jgi:Flp pilus assembly protein TadG